MQPVGDNTDVAERVRAEREQRGWSYRELEAEISNNTQFKISKDTIQRIEEGAKISVNQLVAFSDVFGLTVSEMLAPAEWIRSRRVDYTVRKVVRAQGRLELALARLLDTYREYYVLQYEDPGSGIEVNQGISRQGASTFGIDMTLPSTAGLREVTSTLMTISQQLGRALAVDDLSRRGTPLYRFRGRQGKGVIVTPNHILSGTLLDVPRPEDWHRAEDLEQYMEELRDALSRLLPAEDRGTEK